MEENENIVDGKVPAPEDPLLDRVKNTFLAEYFPIASFETGVIFMTTKEIWDQMQQIYSAEYLPSEIAAWLETMGFRFNNMGDMNYEWMLKPEL
jgi:hypothetical protein